MELNIIQKAAYELIRSDARFLYTLTTIRRRTTNVNSNYIMMSQPYIGLFADGADQWRRKIKMYAPPLTLEEKQYYSMLRQKHKLYELPYTEYKSLLIDKFKESDTYFYSNRSLLEKIIGYYNVGTDMFEGEYCGNTILCALYSPVELLTNKDVGPWIRDISIAAGQIAAFFGCDDYEPYRYNLNAYVKYKEFHFFENCPIRDKTEMGFLLFSMLCSINYAIKFIGEFFVDEIPQKFKFAYLQYYYLCDFIAELNAACGTRLVINETLKDRCFRNCLAHYGLGQYLTEDDLRLNDPMMGLTEKAFHMYYYTAKEKLYSYLIELTDQIKELIGLVN